MSCFRRIPDFLLSSHFTVFPFSFLFLICSIIDENLFPFSFFCILFLPTPFYSFDLSTFLPNCRIFSITNFSVSGNMQMRFISFFSSSKPTNLSVNLGTLPLLSASSSRFLIGREIPKLVFLIRSSSYGCYT